MSLVVNNTIIVPLGPIAYRMAQQFEQVLRRRHPERDIPGIEFLPLLEMSADEAGSLYPLPALGLELQPYADLPRLMAEIAPMWASGTTNPHDLVRALQNMPRQRAQIALCQQADAIHARLEELRRELLSHQTMRRRVRLEVQVANPNRLSVFILLSLADTFMNGLLPDLPYLLRHALTAGTADDHDVQIHLVLALPGYVGELALPPEQSERGRLTAEEATRRSTTAGYVRALVTACLREVDYTCGHPQDPILYQRQLSNNLTIRCNGSPLGEGRIVLLEPMNEKEVQLDNVEMLTAMVGDWLYYMTCTGLSDLLSPQSARDMTPYCSIGHGSLVVPIELWMQRASAGLQRDLLTHLFQPAAGQWTPAMDAHQLQLGLTPGGLRARLRAGTNTALPLQNRSRNAPLRLPQRFLSSLQRAYTDSLTQTLLPLRGEMRRQERRLTDWQASGNLLGALEAKVNQLLDEPNGIATARDFLDGLRARLLADHQTTIAERTSQEKRALGKGVDAAMDSERRGVFRQAQIAAGPGGVPFFWLGVLLGLLGLATAALAVWLWPVSRVAAAAAVGVTLLAAAYVLTRESYALRLAREGVTRAYESRLQALHEREVLCALESLYEELLPVVAGMRDRVNRLTQLLGGARANIEKAWQGELGPIGHLGSDYHHGISRSLLAPGIVEAIERPTGLRRTEDQLERFFQEAGRPSRWLNLWAETSSSKANSSEQLSFAETLAAFAAGQAQQALQGAHLAEVLRYTPREEAALRLRELLQGVAPFVQLDAATRSRLGPPRFVVAAPEHFNLTQHFGPPASTPFALLNQPTPGEGEQLPDPLRDEANLELMPTDDVYQLVLSSVRHGLRLPALPFYANVLARDYATYRRQDAPRLHTLPDRVTLPEPRSRYTAPRNDRPTARELYVLARALNLFELRGYDQAVIWREGRQVVGQDGYAAVDAMEGDEQMADQTWAAIVDARHYVPVAEVAREWAANPTPELDQWARALVEEALKGYERCLEPATTSS